MLLKRSVAEAIAAGTVRVQYRRWSRRRVKVGTWIHTPVGVIVVDSIEEIDPTSLTDADARAAGAQSLDAMMRGFRGGDRDPVFAIGVTFTGADPRVALREDDDLGPDELADILARLERMDARSGEPWVWATLAIIDRSPAVLAADLATEIGSTRDVFKPRVRRLKALGLTESLKVGYRLSPRGETVLTAHRNGQ